MALIEIQPWSEEDSTEKQNLTELPNVEPSFFVKPDPTLGEFTGKMIGAGVDQVQGLGYGVAGLAGDLVGSETVKQFGLEGFQRNMQEAAQAREDVGMVDFTDIDGVGSAGKWAYGTLLEQLPQLLPTIGLGGIGGKAGQMLVKKGLQEVIETGVASGLSRQAAEAAVANAVATRGGAKAFLTGAVDKSAARQLMEGGFTREATEQALGKIAAGKLAPQAGVAAGNVASGMGMEMGSIYGETEDAGLAVGYGAAAGAVEGLADSILFSPFTKRAFGVDVAERVAKNKSLPKEIGKGFVKGVAVEGPLEEYPQTYIEQMARAEADPTFDINSEEAKRERLNAMAAGSVVGGTIGPVGGALEALAPKTKEALDRFTQKPLSDPETGLPAEPQAPPQAREYDQEPVTLENGTVMRRFKIAGTSQEGWAVENAPEGALNEIAKANAAFFDDGKLILAPGFTASATLIQRAEDARAKALGNIDEKEAEQEAPPAKKQTPFLFDDSGSVSEPDPNADVIQDFGVARPPVKFKPAPEALGRRVRYEGYEGVLARDGERYKLRVDEKTEVELPANAEVETAEPVPLSSVRGDTALTTAVRTDESGDLVKDFAISQDGQTDKSSGSYPEDEGSTPSPATPSPDIDAANEIAKATLDLEPVAIVDTIEEVSKTEDLDDNAVSLLDDAQKALEDAITQIESRDLSPDAKKAATDPLYTKLDQVDRIQREYNPEKEPSEKLPPAPLEKELEAAQAEYERKLAEQQQATKEALDSRTDEQTQEFVKNLPTGTKVIVDLDGPNDIVGSVEKNEEGALVVRDQNNKPRVVPPALHDRVALAPAPLVKPTLETTVQAALGPKPDYDTLTRAGFDSAGQTTEKVGDTVHPGVPVFSFKDKGDRVSTSKLPLKATFYTEEGASAPTPKFFYEHSPKRTTRKTTATKETDLREMLRAMDRGYEVRIANGVEVPQGVQITPVEGTNYSVVTGIQNFSKRGVNLGSFTWGDKGLRHESGREGNGTFAEVWQGDGGIQAIRADLSALNNRTRRERGTDATTGAAKRAAGFNEIGTAIYDALMGRRTVEVEVQDKDGNVKVEVQESLGAYARGINRLANGESLSGASDEVRENFRDEATNKLLNALGKAGVSEPITLTPKQQSLVNATIQAYLGRQGAGEGVKKGELPQTKLNEIKKELLGDATVRTTPEAIAVNATLNALQKVAMFSNPKTQRSVFKQAIAVALKGARPQAVSLETKVGTKVGDESGTALGEFVTAGTSGRAAATEVKSNKDLEPAQGAPSEEQLATIKEQEKEAAEIVNSIGDLEEALKGLRNSLSPLEKIAYDFLAATDKKTKDKLYGQLEDQIEDPVEFIRDIEEKITDSARRAAERAGGKTYSPAASSERKQSIGAQGLEGGTLNRASTSDSVRRIKRRFLQARAGLTDEQIVGMADDEIDRAFLAFNSRADESKAAKAQDAVVSVAPGIEDLQALGTDELLSEYAKQVREAAESGDMGAVRDANFAELVRLGAFASTREFLTRAADPKNKLSRDMQLRAKAFLGMEKRGVKLDAIEIQAANFLKTGTPDRASWAGLLGRSADYKSFGVYINLDQAHDRETPAQTILHEIAHATTLAKINGVVKLTPEEQRIVDDLDKMRRRAILRAGDASPTIKAEAEAQGITDPRDRTAFYETRLRELSSTDPEFRDYNGLANLDEFVVEMTGSPEFLDLLRRLGFGGADTDRKSLGGMIRDAFNAILKLIAPGISATSEIGKAFTDSWNLTYAGSKPVIKAGELLQATRGITEVQEAAPVPKKGTKKKSSAVEKKSTTVDAAAPQGNKGSTTSDNDKTATPESNNQSNAQPESKNPEVPSDGQAGKGSGAKVKRDKPGRPPKREMRDETQLPVSKEEFEAEMAQGEMTAEEREAEFKKAPQSPAAKPRVVRSSALTDAERDKAELRASNMEDILFYSGIAEDQYYNLIGKGILSPKEIETGYMQDVPQMLSNIAGDETQPGPLRHVAQMLLDLGFDFSKVRFRVAETADAQAEGGWAGLYEPGTSARNGRISVNMDADHNGGVAQTLVHEALHHVFYWKTQKGYPLNRVERAAFNDLQKIFKQAERVALGRYTRAGESIGQARARLAPGDLFYGLTNVDEFITEILTNPSFQVFLQQTPPMQGLPKKGGYIRNLLDQIFSYFRDFIYGRDVSGDSLLTQGLDNVLALIQTPQTDSGVQRAMGQMLGESVARATKEGRVTLSDIAEQMPIDPIAQDDTVDVPKDKYDRGLLKKAVTAAGKAFNGIFGKTVTAVDGRKILIERAGEGILETFRHITQHNEPGLQGEYNLQKLKTVPMIKKTLETAQARLRDDEAGTFLYVRRIGKNEWHTVIVRPDGTIEDQTVTARLTTQFSMGRQARQFRLPVDEEDTSLALWRINTPLVQSGEPETRNRSQAIEQSGPVNPEAPMSPAGDLKKTVAKLTGKEIITTPTGGTYEKGGLLSTDGKLDKRAGDRWRKRGMRIGAQERMVNMAVQKLAAAVKAERKAGRDVSTGLMNTALGNLDNPLTQNQRAEVKARRAEAEEAKGKQREALEKEANELEAAYMAKNREAFKVRQAQALAQLPADVAEAISEMTQHITALSSALKASGIVEPGLGATIDANLGIYLHRSYEIFDNPKFKDAIRKNERIMSDAQGLIRRQIESRNADKLIAMAAEEGGILPRAEALRQARGTAKQEEVDRTIEQLLAVGEESLGGVILRGRIPGQMDLSILDARGNISLEIQALWGRYEDPTINYAKTALKITTILENNAFLGDLRSLGLKEGWLHEGEDHPPGYLKISSDNNKSLAPIAGLYGNRDFVEALYAMYPPNGIAENYEWVRFFSKLTGVSMASKTVLSAAAHVRNFAGNFLNLAASGNLGINDLPFLSGGRYKKALNLTIRSTFSNMKAQEFKDTIKELTELGVLNESLTSGLLKDLIGTKRVAGNALAFSDAITDRLLKKPAAAIWDVAQKSYGSGDEFFKVVIYLSELEKYRKAMPEWSEQQLKENAAKIARDVHWTYSLSPVAVGKIKQFPFVAPFITFTTEVIRTTRNTMALAYNEIKEGNRTGNKELSAIGWKRVRGMGIAALAPSTAAGAIGMMAGISGEDDDDLRRFLPDWQKNSQLMVFRNKDGKVSFIDVSYLDPYEYWKRPITAFLRALAAPDDSSAMERITEGAVQAGAQLLNPFAAEQILSGAILDIARNQKQDGGQLWNPEDTGARVAAKIGDHLWNAFEPGTLTSAGRIKDAALGNVSDSGRSYGLGNEVASVLLGQRVSELDVTQALGFKTSRTSRALRDASSLFTREFSSKGTRSDEQIMDAYNRANDATFEIAKDYREDVDAAMRLSGMTAKQISEIASAGGLGKEKIKMILSGRFTRYTPSKDQIKLAKALGNQDRITSARQAESAAPKVRELR